MTKKEIGMGKLMKYVEEMQKEGINICRPQFQEYYLVDMMLISKYYGLIKRLVENDKIDRDKKEIEKSDYDITFTGALTKDKKSDLDIMVDTLLMLLAIQDEPIRFLCEIIK